jgi:hypothetical protein
VRRDGGMWKVSQESFLWNLHSGRNRLESRTLNKFGVFGPLSTVELEVQ